MTKVSEYLAQASHYIDDNSRAIVEQLTDAQFAALVEASDEYAGGSEPGIDNGLVCTFETIEDFEASRRTNWAGCRDAETFEIAGLRGRRYEGVQMLKGQPRHDFAVVDMGEYRIVLK